MFFNIKNIIAIMLVIFLWITIELIHDIRHNSNELGKDLNIAEKTKLLDDIQSNIGYIGFIQNYESFLVNQDPNTYAAAEKNLRDLRANITSYMRYSSKPKNLKALKKLDEIVSDYERHLDRAKSLAHKDDIREINTQVNSDISEAHLTLETLSKNILAQINHIESSTENDIGNNDTLVFYLRLMLPLIFISAGLLLYIYTAHSCKRRNYQTRPI